MKKKYLKLCMMTMLICGSASASSQQIIYPAAPVNNDVSDSYFGIIVKDPYRPLENDTAPETLDWVKAQNAVTEDYLSRIPFRQNLKERLKTLNNYKKTGLTFKGNDGKYYYFENDGLQNQNVLYRTTELGGKPEVFLDPNKFSEDGTVALQGLSLSKDGKYSAYIIARSGSDWNEIYVMDTEGKKLLDDKIEWVKFSRANWKGDGFYYSAYPKPEEGKEFSNTNENHQIYYHKLGTPQSEDILIYEDKDHPLRFHTAYVPKSEDYLFVIGAGEGNGNSLTFKDLKKDGEWVVIEPSQEYSFILTDVIDGKAYIMTNWQAPKNRLIVVDLANPSRENWKELVPEGNGVMKDINFSGDNTMFVTFEKDAADHLIQFDLAGNMIRKVDLPTFGEVQISSDRDSNEVFYSLTSFAYPSARFTYDPTTGESKFLGAPEIKGVNMDDYVTEQVFYPSKDGTMIPMFLTYKKGLNKDGNNPVYLYGYGGFNVSLTPGFSPNRMLWLENGGIYAQTNLRGGAEYGDDWHLAGTKMNKQNVFDDFISAAEYLIKEGYTNPEKIAIEGGSNGGLLIGAVVNQRPELFKAAIPRVGVMDMMRYHLFTIGWNWAPDYGTSADSPEMAQYLLNYSPLHNIKNDGTKYPAIMVTTADHDDRVVPAHSFKYAATLQAANTGDQPKIIRIDSKAGHGAGKPVTKVIDEYTDIYSFIFNNLGITPKNY